MVWERIIDLPKATYGNTTLTMLSQNLDNLRLEIINLKCTQLAVTELVVQHMTRGLEISTALDSGLWVWPLELPVDQ